MEVPDEKNATPHCPTAFNGLGHYFDRAAQEPEIDPARRQLDAKPDAARFVTGAPARFGSIAHVLAGIFGTAIAGVGPAVARAEDTRHEFWPEVQVFVGLSPSTRVMVLGNISRARETQTNLEGQLGIALDHRLTDFFSIRGGYRFVGSLEEGVSRTEHRLLLEQTFHFKLPAKFLLSLRTREDLRFINGEFSARIRERAMLERDVEIVGYTFTPYGSAEIYYDTRFEIFNRHRFIAGSVFPVTKWLAVDAYYARQNDIRSDPRHVNAFGLTAIFTF